MTHTFQDIILYTMSYESVFVLKNNKTEYIFIDEEKWIAESWTPHYWCGRLIERGGGGRGMSGHICGLWGRVGGLYREKRRINKRQWQRRRRVGEWVGFIRITYYNPDIIGRKHNTIIAFACAHTRVSWLGVCVSVTSYMSLVSLLRVNIDRQSCTQCSYRSLAFREV